MKSKATNALLTAKLLPLFYHDDVEVCKKVLDACYAANIRAFEFTNRGVNALTNFIELKAHCAHNMPDMLLGIGTIKDGQTALAYIEAGADFLISPVVDAEVAKVAAQHNQLWIAGCMTPTEIHTAAQLGCGLVKLFPGNLLGPGFVSAIKDLFPNTKFIVTGGVEVTPQNIGAWFAAGVVGVGLGSKVINNTVIAANDYESITQNINKARSYIPETK